MEFYTHTLTERRVNRKHKRDKRSTHDRYSDFYYYFFYYNVILLIYLCTVSLAAHSLLSVKLSFSGVKYFGAAVAASLSLSYEKPDFPISHENETKSLFLFIPFFLIRISIAVSFTLITFIMAYCHSTWLTGIMRGMKSNRERKEGELCCPLSENC